MTREQARAILAHIDLIKHFAEGGDIGLRLHTHRGEYVHTVPQRHIVLGNLREEGTNLVRVKPRFTYNTKFGVHERSPRSWPETIPESHIIKGDA
jgi:hypothetical protein